MQSNDQANKFNRIDARIDHLHINRNYALLTLQLD